MNVYEANNFLIIVKNNKGGLWVLTDTPTLLFKEGIYRITSDLS